MCEAAEMRPDDIVAEWLRRRPARPMGSPCVGSNPAGVVFAAPCQKSYPRLLSTWGKLSLPRCGGRRATPNRTTCDRQAKMPRRTTLRLLIIRRRRQLRRCFSEALSTCGLVAMTSASHAEGRQFDPGQVYFFAQSLASPSSARRCTHHVRASVV